MIDTIVFIVVIYFFVVFFTLIGCALESIDEFGKQKPKKLDDYTDTEVMIRILLWPVVVIRFIVIKLPIGFIDIIKRG